MKIQFYLLALVVLSACKKNADPKETTQATFDRTALLENIGQQILPNVHQDFELKTNAFHSSINQLVNTPNLNNLQNAQQLWKEMATSWKKVEVYNIGEIETQFLHSSIDYWPSNIAFINNFIYTDTTSINDTFIKLKGASSKGIAGIEYLLFDPVNGNDSILARMTNSERYRDYMFWTSNELTTRSTTINTTWDFNGNGYAQTFQTDASTGIDSPINELANQLIALTRKVIEQKIGKPLGVFNFDTPQPGKVESLYARHSKELIQQQLAHIHDVFLGGTGVGFDDYLRTLKADHVANSIDQMFTNILSDLDHLNTSIYDGVNNQGTVLDSIYHKGVQLIQLLKTDMASELNIIVTPSDTDGD